MLVVQRKKQEAEPEVAEVKMFMFFVGGVDRVNKTRNEEISLGLRSDREYISRRMLCWNWQAGGLEEEQRGDLRM